MIIACDKEMMQGEGRVALTPDGVKKIRDCEAEILVAQYAGKKSGYSDRSYKDVGAAITSRDSLWRKADLIVRVKQPLPENFAYFHYGLMIACFGHLAANLPLLECLLNTGVTLIDYGTIQTADGSPRILNAMSDIAGEIAVVDGEFLLKKSKGKILRPGTNAAIIGMGHVGTASARRILATGARLYCFDKNEKQLERAQKQFSQFSPYQVWYLRYDQTNPDDQKRLAAILEHVDLLIGATYTRAQHTGAPVPEQMIENMESGSVLEDVAIDQGGCFATSSDFFVHGKQIFTKHEILHVCIPNMPGTVPKISTPALCKETLPRIKEIAQKGFAQAVRENPALANGVMTHKGWVTSRALAEDKAVNRMDRYKPLEELL